MTFLLRTKSEATCHNRAVLLKFVREE